MFRKAKERKAMDLERDELELESKQLKKDLKQLIERGLIRTAGSYIYNASENGKVHPDYTTWKLADKAWIKKFRDWKRRNEIMEKDHIPWIFKITPILESINKVLEKPKPTPKPRLRKKVIIYYD